MSAVRRLFVLLCGYEFVPESVSLRGWSDRFILSLPICCYLLDTEEGWILLDTGVNQAILDDPERSRRHFGDHGMMAPVVRKPHRMESLFAEIGIGYRDVSRVILSHLHLDHSGQLRHFAHAPIHIQRREYDHAFGGAADWAYFAEDYAMAGLDWRPMDGDWQACAGLRLIATPGHTPGHQSAVVELANSGTVILPFDAGDLRENFTDEILPGYTSGDEDALSSIRRLKDIERSSGGRMILFHDPAEIRETILAPAWYD